MERRTFDDITVVNQLGMLDFIVTSFDGSSKALHIQGDRGYPHLYRVELKFIGVMYLAITPYFDDWFDFRLATPQEASEIPQDLEGADQLTLYCIEEDVGMPPLPRKAQKFYIFAYSVEVIVYLKGGGFEELLGLGSPQGHDTTQMP